MSFAFPARKSSQPPPFVAVPPRSSPRFWRLRRPRTWIMIASLIFFIVLLSQFRGGRSQAAQQVQQVIPPNTPPVIVVTTFYPSMTAEHRRMIIENRQEYAALHGYATFLPTTTDYPLDEADVPESWSKIPALRHAMTLYPHSTYFFYVDYTAIITNPTLSLTEHITNPARIESLMIPDQPIVPPDSVIWTLHSRKASHVDLIVTQDHEGLSQNTIVVRRGEWAKFFLDSWYDPLYRSYNFQRAEGHALEHLVQWHGAVLARMAIIPQTIMNSYLAGQDQERYAEGHFIAVSQECDQDGKPPCESTLKPHYNTFKAALGVGL